MTPRKNSNGRLGNPPTSWGALSVLRPTGNSLYTQRSRVLVRGFDTEHSRYVDIDDEDRFLIDDSHVNIDESHPVRVGDLLMLNGQFEGDDETSVCAPERVIAVGSSSSKNHVRVWSLVDMDQLKPTLGDYPYSILRSLLSTSDRRLVGDLALDGRPATASEAARLRELFGLPPS